MSLNILRLLLVAFSFVAVPNCLAFSGPNSAAISVEGADVIVYGTLTEAKSELAFTGVLKGKVYILKVHRVLYGTPDLKTLNFQMYASTDGLEGKAGESAIWFLKSYTKSEGQAGVRPHGQYRPPQVGVDHKRAVYDNAYPVCYLTDPDLSDVLAEIKKRLQSDLKYIQQALRQTERNLKADPKGLIKSNPQKRSK